MNGLEVIGYTLFGVLLVTVIIPVAKAAGDHIVKTIRESK